METLMATHGFKLEGSGGGGEWWFRDNDGSITTITDPDGMTAPRTLDEPALVVYSTDETFGTELAVTHNFDTLAKALTSIAGF